MLSRRSAFDVVGANAAVGWYPPGSGEEVSARWVAGGRLSLRAWATVAALRLAHRFGLGAAGATREEISGREIYSFPGGDGQALHLFLAGRVLVAGNDRPLVLKAAGSVQDKRSAVTREPSWQTIRKALPADGEFFVWVRDLELLPGATAFGRVGPASCAALLRAGKALEIDVVAEPAATRAAGAAGAPAGAIPEPLPASALLRQPPLFLFSSREPVPSMLTDLLLARRRQVLQQSPRQSTSPSAGTTGRGYALVITDATAGSGLFPAVQGLAVIGMSSAAAAGATLVQLFPPGARQGDAGGTRAFATRESFPLAGQFELWGAAIGSRLVFATDTALIDALTADDPAAAAVDSAHSEPAWRVDAVAAISMEKALPLVRRWAAPLSGLIVARWPQAPEIARDLELLAAVRTVRMSAGSDERRDRAAITLSLRDLP